MTFQANSKNVFMTKVENRLLGSTTLNYDIEKVIDHQIISGIM
jgi:hypothetical protein